MNSQRIVGIVLMLLGAGIWITGLNASDSAADRWSNFFTGHFTDQTTWYIVGGIVMSLFGLVVTIAGGRSKTA